MTYITSADLKSYLGMDPTDTTRDSLITMVIAASCAAIDRTTGRTFTLASSATARVFDADPYCLDVVTHDFGSLTGLVVEVGYFNGAYSTITDYDVQPLNALAVGQPITGLRRPYGFGRSPYSRVRVTAKWGWPAVPDEVVQAALIQASRLFKRKDSPEGVLGSAEWGVVRLSRVDPDVSALLSGLTLPGF